MSFLTQIRRHARELAAAVALIVVAVAVSGYILSNQRLRFPWEDVYRLKAEFASAQAVTPGQGQNVQVAGVHVGEIVRVELRDGRAAVTSEIDRQKLPAVYADARMLLRPKTGLNDMSIQLDPGTPAARRLGEDDVLPVARTLPHVNPDEVLAALDADTRTYLQVVANAGGRGLRGRGEDLRAILRASQPTLRTTRRITDALRDRRAALARLVRNLRLIAEAAAEKDDQLASLVSTGSAAVGTLARREGELREALDELPPTLDELSGSLTAVRGLAQAAPATFSALTPAVRRLPRTLRDVRPLLRDGAPIVRTQLRPLVREARPLARDLRPALTDLDAVTPALTSAFVVLNYVVNELAYNPEGSEEGYLFWLAWFAHNANSILSIEDAHGVAWRGQLITSCSTYAALPELAPTFAPLVGAPVCPEEPQR